MEEYQAQGPSVQSMKSSHQAAPNQGSWCHAWLLARLPEPHLRKPFAANLLLGAGVGGVDKGHLHYLPLFVTLSVTLFPDTMHGQFLSLHVG